MNKRALVKTNDPKHSNLTIGLYGVVSAPIFVDPPYAALTAMLGERVEATVYIIAQEEAPLALDLISMTVPDDVDVTLSAVKKDKVYALHVSGNLQAAGRFRGEARLKTNYPDKPELGIPIVGYIKAPIEISPEKLNFGRLSTDQIARWQARGISMRRPLIIKLNSGDHLKINKVETEKSLFQVVSSREMRQGQIIQLQIKAVLDKLQPGKNADHLKIYINQKGHKVLDVPVYIEVTP